MSTAPDGLKFLTWDGTPRVLGTLWALEKAGRRMTCELRTHPLGWELRAVVSGDDLPRTETGRTEANVFDIADRWRLAAETKGWARVGM